MTSKVRTFYLITFKLFETSVYFIVLYDYRERNTTIFKFFNSFKKKNAIVVVRDFRSCRGSREPYGGFFPPEFRVLQRGSVFLPEEVHPEQERSLSGLRRHYDELSLFLNTSCLSVYPCTPRYTRNGSPLSPCTYATHNNHLVKLILPPTPPFSDTLLIV